MKALLRFHIRVGVRLAVQSFTPLFSAILALIILYMHPVAMVIGMARSLFAPRPEPAALIVLAALALGFAAWAAPRVAHGLNGWLRHLPISGAANRRGLLLALVVVQMPLAIAVLLLAVVAHTQGLSDLGLRLLRYALLMPAVAFAVLPVMRRWLTGSFGVLAAMLALFGSAPMLAAAAALIVAADLLGGHLRQVQRQSWRAAGMWLEFRIAWRALGWRILGPFAASLAMLGATALFIANNAPPRPLDAGVLRFGGGMALLLFSSGTAGWLAIRRPVWPWARSLPRSAVARVSLDALFLAAHAVPLILIVGSKDPLAALATLATLPLLSIRAASHMRRLPERRAGMGAFFLEGFFVAGLLALLPWTAFVWLAAAVPILEGAAEIERRQKVTRWRELHHLSAGDPLSWSGR